MNLDWNLVANVASVVGTVGGLVFVWWQVRQIREVNAYELLRDEVKRYNAPEMRVCRARLALTLLVSRRDFEKIEEDGKEVCAYFEDIGLLLRRGVVPRYYIWSMLSDDIFYYWQLLHDYLNWVRQTTKNKLTSRISICSGNESLRCTRSEQAWNRHTPKTSWSSSWKTRRNLATVPRRRKGPDGNRQ
jgi:hypothetical protein